MGTVEIMRTVDTAPHPSILIESLRDFGYSLETALADIIDNSLAAKASRIDILTDFSDGQAHIAVVDNGRGMSQSKLLEALRLGSQNPLDKRDKHDLGRFGLGLKTASFSQCRRLTVVSRDGLSTAGATWDLDYVAETNHWRVILTDDFDTIPGYERLGKTGTIVLWQNLDRLTEKSDRASNERHFEERMNDAIDHLELVYHRFLVREDSHKAITIAVNDRLLVPVDPFMSDHRKTQVEPDEPITYDRHKTTLRGYTLPNPKDISPSVWERIGGKEGHIRNQGFYVYRERRLIVWGTWFGLASKAEINKLTRIRVDIGNDTDADWKIDVRKSSAHPPLPVRNRMKSLVERLTEGSRNVHLRQRRQTQLNPLAAGWVSQYDGSYVRFEPNLNHPVILQHVESLTADQRVSFALAMNMLTSSLPMDQIYARMSSKPEQPLQADLKDTELEAIVGSVYTALAASGLELPRIKSALHYEEPFRSHWDRVKQILEALADNTVKGKTDADL